MPGTPQDAPTPPQEPTSSAFLRASAAYPQQTAQLVTQLQRPARTADDLLELLDRGCREAVRTIDDVDWAGISAHLGGPPFTAAHTAQRVLIVDEGQYEQNDGPCVQAVRTDTPVAMTLEQVADRWPHLTQAATDAGVLSFLALPLHAAGRAVGSLNLYSAHAGGVRNPQPDLLTVLAELLDRGLDDYLAVLPLQLRAQQLLAALTGRVTVNTAVGILMARAGLDHHNADTLLRDTADRMGVGTAALAALIVAEHLPPDPNPAT